MRDDKNYPPCEYITAVLRPDPEQDDVGLVRVARELRRHSWWTQPVWMILGITEVRGEGVVVELLGTRYRKVANEMCGEIPWK